jgi:hypothetical protein
MTDASDHDLLDRVAAGDREALRVIVRRHQGTIYRLSGGERFRWESVCSGKPIMTSIRT